MKKEQRTWHSSEDRELSQLAVLQDIFVDPGRKKPKKKKWLEKRVFACECVSKEPSPGWFGSREKYVCVCVGDYLSVQDCTAAQVLSSTWSHVLEEAKRRTCSKRFTPFPPGTDHLANSCALSCRQRWERYFPSFFWKQGRALPATGKHINSAHWPSCSEVKNKLIFYQKACLDLPDRSTKGQEEHE